MYGDFETKLIKWQVNNTQVNLTALRVLLIAEGRSLLHKTCYMLLATCYLLLATCYLLLATCYLLCYLLCYVLPATYCLLLATCYSLCYSLCYLLCYVLPSTCCLLLAVCNTLESYIQAHARRREGTQRAWWGVERRSLQPSLEADQGWVDAATEGLRLAACACRCMQSGYAPHTHKH